MNPKTKPGRRGGTRQAGSKNRSLFQDRTRADSRATPAARYRRANLEAAQLILADVDAYAGEHGLPARWARAFLAAEGQMLAAPPVNGQTSLFGAAGGSQ